MEHTKLSKQPTQILIFTDLDGTLLSETTYEPGPTLPVLKQCRERNIPVIFCSSKTAPEIISLRERLDNSDPFIVENGGGIYVPRGAFPISNFIIRKTGAFDIIEIGAPVSELRAALKTAAEKTAARVRGLGEMSVAEVIQLTGLKEDRAKLAMERQFDEPFILVSGNPERLAREIHQLGYSMTRGGRFFHILGRSDKGKAVKILSFLYKTFLPNLLTIGLGDAENDLPLFRSVDRAFLVQKPSGKWEAIPSLPNLMKVNGIGPWGWAKAVYRLLVEAGYRLSPRPK